MTQDLLRLDDDHFNSLLAMIERFMGVTSSEEASRISDELSAGMGLPVQVLGASIGWITSVAQATVDSGPEEARSSIASIYEGPDEERFLKRIDRIIAAASEKQDAIRATENNSTAVKGLLPYLESIQATVEMRAVLEGRTTTYGHLRREKDRIVGAAPVLTVSLAFDSGFPNAAVFQVGREDLDRMISSLVEASRRMDEFHSFLLEGKK